MTDLPEFSTEFRAEDGEPIAETVDGRFASIAALLDALPALIEPGNETVLARLVSHFARGATYRVVSDPEAFQAAYRADMATEDPTKPWRQDSPRRTDFGVPDFAQITAPARQGDMLVFTLEDCFTGLPYAASASLARLDRLDLRPLALGPVQGFPEDLEKSPGDQSTGEMINAASAREKPTPETEDDENDEEPATIEPPDIPRRGVPRG